MIPQCGVSVSTSVTRLRCVKMTGWIEVLFGVETPRNLRHTVLDSGPDPSGKGSMGNGRKLAKYSFTAGEISWVSVWVGDCFFSKWYLRTEKA